ncbi:MAG: hypothetical protein LBH25_00910 [Fibromonadaceae bacterium]|jgi:uncharacterized protein (TIGR02145 family)|nr:hypothetical protein [Fibromonadaceae bacterium]
MKKFLLLVFIVLPILGCGYEVYYESSSSSSWQSSSSELSGNLSSSSRQQSSSSNLSSSSRQSGVILGVPVDYGDETYETIVIGSQIWFKRNLNYDPGTGNSDCSNGRAANCDEYGRLYDWSTAMGLASSCNSMSCSGQINAKHRGICPSGWHIPSNEDWDTLVRYADGTSGTGSPYNSPTAGKYLKAASGWVSNGQDTYGFSALPRSNEEFINGGGWWSSSEYNSSYVYCLGMDDSESVSWHSGHKSSSLNSIRCLQD